MYPHVKNTHDEETKKTYAEKIQTLVAFFDKKLEQSGTTYINSSKLTIGDFYLGALIFSLVFNDNLGGGEDYTRVGKEIVARHSAFNQYIERLRHEMKEYLETRGAYPL